MPRIRKRLVIILTIHNSDLFSSEKLSHKLLILSRSSSSINIYYIRFTHILYILHIHIHPRTIISAFPHLPLTYIVYFIYTLHIVYTL